jgi:hypothetical protein
MESIRGRWSAPPLYYMLTKMIVEAVAKGSLVFT